MKRLTEIVAALAVSTVTPVANRSSCPSSSWSSILTGGSCPFSCENSPFISACCSPVGGGIDTGAVCAFDFILDVFLPLRLPCGRVPLLETCVPTIRDARGLFSSSSSSASLNEDEEIRRLFAGGCKSSSSSCEETDEGGRLSAEERAVKRYMLSRVRCASNNGTQPQVAESICLVAIAGNLPGDATASVRGLAAGSGSLNCDRRVSISVSV